ncbi:LysM peptidoglycan-binding domain-containing protein [Massilibacterium senegalense]|uniref:LysM peptidoglycan-binding domain-containing protein n=1 Tax=Massilibacterium senegalense TaxID=1632858 RepID=UPI000785BE28|nr:LysM peptidoglycan-binding domain-containing protein [Massilibacterium senegalense]
MKHEEGLLRFSISEFVNISQAQVKQMISLSLEPNISVEPLNDLVTMKGALILQGEYESGEDDLAGNVRKLEHSFPIDITIPKSRVTSLDTIQLMIESFDYDFEEQERLIIQADLLVSGITNESAFVLEEREKETLEEPLVRMEAGHKQAERVEDEAVETSTVDTTLLGEEQMGEMTIEKQEEKEVRPLVQIEATREENDRPLVQVESTREEKHPVVVEEIQVVQEIQKEETEEARNEESKEQDAHVHEGEFEQEFLLSELFATDEEDHFSQVKIYIVQRDETLHTVASRYEMPVDELVRFNDLKTTDVEAGMLVYVPKVTKKA